MNIPKVKWVNQNPGASPDEGRYWVSLEGRFSITPNFRHTIYPDSYTVVDALQRRGPAMTHVTFDTIRDCKDWANDQVRITLENAL